jgi:hypothetical protein
VTTLEHCAVRQTQPAGGLFKADGAFDILPRDFGLIPLQYRPLN